MINLFLLVINLDRTHLPCMMPNDIVVTWKILLCTYFVTMFYKANKVSCFKINLDATEYLTKENTLSKKALLFLLWQKSWPHFTEVFFSSGNPVFTQGHGLYLSYFSILVFVTLLFQGDSQSSRSHNCTQKKRWGWGRGQARVKCDSFRVDLLFYHGSSLMLQKL